MDAFDLEVGPTQRMFDSLFKSIGKYFQAAPVAPIGVITETNLSTYTQDQLRKTLNISLKHFGFTDLPSAIRIIIENDSEIKGIQRSDEITTYDEKLKDGSHRTFNFYNTNGPENMKASFYWLDMKKSGEQTKGILTKNDKWYFQIITSQNIIYYQRTERETPHY